MMVIHGESEGETSTSMLGSLVRRHFPVESLRSDRAVLVRYLLHDRIGFDGFNISSVSLVSAFHEENAKDREGHIASSDISVG